eukprot:TRINITY_DN2026_c0_g1_i1.p1 TRINITY_DN2026_c0_g1~~TRINITY_DN2026_c0_g1_i1.p1  ORF type:complete len:151 (+),score=41.39 TRINITY_DN2026_c0_g1_i1:159-611(+)
MSANPCADLGQWSNTNNRQRVVVGMQCMKKMVVSDTMKVVAAFLGERDAADEERHLENVRLTSWVNGQDAGWMSSAALHGQMNRLNSQWNTVRSVGSDSASDNGLSSEGSSQPATPKLLPTSPSRHLIPRCDLGAMNRAPATRGPKARSL